MTPSICRSIGLPLALAMLVSLSAVPTLAQATVVVNSLTIEFWPEYDRPEMLVIVRGNLAADTTLPAAVTVRVPAASEINAVAVEAADGALLNTPYTTELAGGELRILIQSATRNFHLEYYDPAITVDGRQRAYSFEWTADHPIASAEFVVQQPPGATGLAGQPALQPTGVGSGGLNYHHANLGSVAAGESLRFQLSYAKPDNTLTAAASPAEAPAATGAPLAVWQVGGLILGGLLIAGGAAWFIISRRGAVRRVAPRARQRRPPGRPAAPAGTPRFCSQCGQPIRPGDQFCRSCGARVRG